MSTKELGRAKYSAFRIGGITHVMAVGETPNWNDKVDIEQLPFRIFPPWYALYFISPDVRIPTNRPFAYHEAIAYPKEPKIIRIQDEDGMHDVPIATLAVPDITDLPPPKRDANYCVFNNLASKDLLIAECDTPLPRIYGRVFGPATLAECEKFVKEKGGTPG
jgi:hypothetical protein